ncbi:hypothetical protein B0T24DRAFT_346033 [Lasiosphaeria ovina]|uniref:Uncharacterized protein n=1 Tax=Lasiosphaeria ovina TaxID=92902 RepID=A0AAE0K3Q4_9PEZI|nr:hypothetical protein B0T24DRAFT_346033 [Lasiosphaeria ovina]
MNSPTYTPSGRLANVFPSFFLICKTSHFAFLRRGLDLVRKRKMPRRCVCSWRAPVPRTSNDVQHSRITIGSLSKRPDLGRPNWHPKLTHCGCVRYQCRTPQPQPIWRPTARRVATNRSLGARMPRTGARTIWHFLPMRANAFHSSAYCLCTCLPVLLNLIRSLAWVSIRDPSATTGINSGKFPQFSIQRLPWGILAPLSSSSKQQQL